MPEHKDGFIPAAEYLRNRPLKVTFAQLAWNHAETSKRQARSCNDAIVAACILAPIQELVAQLVA